MNYPPLEQYNEALQHPQLALIDPELKKGSIARNGLGLPLTLCGGFALTYTVTTGNKKYAIRCFHKKSDALEIRYRAISNCIKSLRSPYFVDFEFQNEGVRVDGKAFPIVKMAWASGNTLGEFLEKNHRSKKNLQQLNASLRTLVNYLEGQRIAHGDIQPGNVMVANGGQNLQLIDYDGMFVDALKNFGSTERGHRNFQHPVRIDNSWDSRLDRFSFITLNLALRVLESDPDLWVKTQSDGDSILFKANDFADPAQSAIFRDLFGRSLFCEDAKNFAAICKSPFDKIPTLDDFLARRNIPQVVTIVSPTTPTVPLQYISVYSVLDATNYALCFRHVGDRVELIGRIIEVKENKTRHGKSYIFINFGPWKGEITKINIWSEGLAVLTTPTQRPDQSWVGKWVSVVGLMEPPYHNKRYKYSHLSISVTQAGQIHIISESEARHRLSGTRSPTITATKNTNQSILDSIREGTSAPPRLSTTVRPATTKNQAILQRIKGSQPTAPRPGAILQTLPTTTRRTSSSGKNKGCLIFFIIGFFILLFLAFKR